MHCNPPDHRDRSRSTPAWRVLVAAFVAVVFAGHGVAQAPASDPGAAPQISTEELDNLVGRIALYPDDLVAIILPAATNPLQLVQADRFLDKRKSDPKLPIDEKWDDSVKALVNYPDVVKMMSGDLDWTSALGEAVVADQGAVLEAIQAFRRRAQAAGNLKSNDKQVVNVDKTVIEIVPANPEVIYVPQYNPATVIVAGAPAWGYYPTPYPVYYYPYAPGAAFATGLIWGAAIGAAWGGARWGTNWGGGDININRNTNINTGNRGNVNTGNRPSQLPSQGGGTAWKSDKRPGQVSGATGRQSTTGRVGDAGRGGAGSGGGFGGSSGAGRPSATTGGVGGGAGANRPSTGSVGGGGGGAANRAGSVSASPRDSFGGSGGGNALGGYGSGRQTSMDSSRGASSRGSMSGGGGGGGRSMSSGGGGRGGGGGGGRGGGGGGRGGGGRR